ncbi:hypothetical protein A3K34_03330 [candidate division WWE3 bacterium RIFOXYC1_FULL_40_10]|uniref:Protein translocase subunit SecA n=1 Tax=candidate division WWE3 bacterium RIFOXYA2_FULL_46_9 TaxID=1802636 RepID=A0A1F4VYI3_UNCKA|nr:MAG: hypothetical protein A3K58_03330 [candidate division WWE3 bacterium RIFOXYB1_FULL_40_22]OGC61880.1 MAG: hypothetical protein A3K37_03330 [candidate division WWE3 bacterium RIFOXYA1_FULL_40_11]OGC62247.1 MAG: hypothetical protein A2264_03090 [candidate division WWE3 bacterium RIFOXYA2_FULL_46_9]OGC64353.1 MAG: hypothetical protein A2326_00745 [candidate division WWE3 bacterium RIFOXYB2_FULL_41_6]OGC66263.1 MAG: hypothetical protein A3K34_03330 [candidate division WWE3 bacterium RIFOXYC1_
MDFIRKLLDSNGRQINKLKPQVDRINDLYEKLKDIQPDEIKSKTLVWKQALAEISERDRREDYLNGILAEAFALVKEVTRQVDDGKVLHDVQLIAGVVLHQGKIAELKTGEGKTNAATLPLYLNSLAGLGVHLVTPNDYLSRHGAGWMGKIYEMLGVTVGVIMQDRAFIYDSSYTGTEFDDMYAIHLREVSRAEAYKADITYGTNHEFGFDYLRDNMVRNINEMVQTNPIGTWGEHNYAIVDEVDSILIDVARTPLIISAADSRSASRYLEADKIIRSLAKDQDYDVDEKFRTATLSDLGIRRVERLLGIEHLYEEDFEMVHLIEQALIAYALYEKNRDYVVKDDKVIIVDQFTGRLLPSNRYSHGLHQAIEAKESVTIQQESKTLAEISYQNYFRMYKKLAGMTGTALTEAEEFYKIYKLDVLEIPTHKPLIRKDNNDLVYKSESAKFKAVAEEIAERHKNGQPVLVGTTSVEKSELLHNFLTRKNIPHEILNAKNHEREALIIAQAGKKGAVTISTNMAGRGVDIILGGDPFDAKLYEAVKNSGGLHVIGTERHESRRIDNQLRGRSGRQGDPGSSRFFVSFQDDLMRIFGGDKMQGIMDRFGVDESIPLEAGIVTKSIENAQKRVEGFNFDRRKQLVEMDDVINVHREVVYKLRRRVLELESGFVEYQQWLMDKLAENSSFRRKDWDKREEEFGQEIWLNIVSQLSLPVIDFLWMEHLVDMDQVREGIGLRGYAQKDPMVEYKKEGHERFGILITQIYSNMGDRLVAVVQDADKRVKSKNSLENKKIEYKHGEIETGVSEEAKLANTKVLDSSGREFKVQKVASGTPKVGRNNPCPCGSGKKYKNCHGK